MQITYQREHQSYMELLKSHWIRFVYCLISIAIVWAALLEAGNRCRLSDNPE